MQVLKLRDFIKILFSSFCIFCLLFLQINFSSFNKAYALSGDIGTLDVSLSDSENNFVDINEFPDNETEWTVNSIRTLHVEFEFGSGDDKSLAINIPDGYRILGYSATDSTPEMEGVQNIEIDPEYKNFFISSSLKANDGVSPWNEQALEGFTSGWGSLSEESHRVYSGSLLYSFNSLATKGEVIIVLQPQQDIFAHTSEDEVEILDNISVSLRSNSGEELSESFHGKITGVVQGGIDFCNGVTWGYKHSNIGVDPETGISDSFGVLSSTCSYSYDYFFEDYLLDKLTVNFNYPKGIFFDSDAFCDYLGLGTINSNGGEVVPNHFSIYINEDEVGGGTVSLVFNKTTFWHSSYAEALGSFFYADTNSKYLNVGDTFNINVSSIFENQGNVSSASLDYQRTLIGESDNYTIKLFPRNEQRCDVAENFSEYTGLSSMGGFQLHSKLSYINVPIHVDFSDLAGVKGIAVPGYNIVSVKALTSSNRTVEIDSIDGEATAFIGITIGENELGLREDEYLVSLDYVCDLDQLDYGEYYNDSFSYYGKFVNGQEGDVIFSILDGNNNVALNQESEPLICVDHTKIGWDTTGVSLSETYTDQTTYLPNQTIQFESYIRGGGTYGADCDLIVDPILMISLPKGIELDTSSITSYSEGFGNHPDEELSLVQVKTPKKEIINNAEWTTYYFTSENSYDMVASDLSPAQRFNSIVVKFNAIVASNSPDYGQLSLKDCVQWDLGKSAAYSGDAADCTFSDSHNRTGNGEDYNIVGLGNNFTVKRLIGLNVDLGIRVANSGTDFYTYNGTDESVAAVTPAAINSAEVRLNYFNTASSEYFKGSSIYLPIPKKGVDYSRFFENSEITDPVNIESNETFDFSTSLDSKVILDNFVTYYAVSKIDNEETYDPSHNANSWVPIQASWYSYDELIENGYDLSDVVMCKLVAINDIASGSNAEAIFTLLIDDDACIGQMNYWRAYSKAVTNSSTDTGVWNYSSVIAATPVSAGIIGKYFIDTNLNGVLDSSDFSYTGDNITAILSKDGGGMDNLLLATDADGNFASLNENGSTYYLKEGNYTVSFIDKDELYEFSSYEGADMSNGIDWFNDLSIEDIDELKASYHFEINEGTPFTTYIGVALIDPSSRLNIDVPVKITLATFTDGTWCTPTARDNKIINHSRFEVCVINADTISQDDFNLVKASTLSTSTAANSYAGNIIAANGAQQDLSDIDTSDDNWIMGEGEFYDTESESFIDTTDNSNYLSIQLNGQIRHVTNHYFDEAIQVFNIQYTFAKSS